MEAIHSDEGDVVDDDDDAEEEAEEGGCVDGGCGVSEDKPLEAMCVESIVACESNVVVDLV